MRPIVEHQHDTTIRTLKIPKPTCVRACVVIAGDELQEFLLVRAIDCGRCLWRACRSRFVWGLVVVVGGGKDTGTGTGTTWIEAVRQRRSQRHTGQMGEATN